LFDFIKGIFEIRRGKNLIKRFEIDQSEVEWHPIYFLKHKNDEIFIKN